MVHKKIQFSTWHYSDPIMVLAWFQIADIMTDVLRMCYRLSRNRFSQVAIPSTMAGGDAVTQSGFLDLVPLSRSASAQHRLSVLPRQEKRICLQAALSTYEVIPHALEVKTSMVS